MPPLLISNRAFLRYPGGVVRSVARSCPAGLVCVCGNGADNSSEPPRAVRFMRKRLPRIEQIEAFIAAARSHNFRAAAAQCALSPAALSRRIRALTDFTGYALFKRDASGMRLTEHGRQYLEQVEPSFLELRRAASSAGPAGNERSTVKLSLSHSLAVGWLIPRLGALRAKHPGIDLLIRVRRDAAEVRNGDADLGICAQDLDFSNLDTQPLLSVSVTPMAQPTIAEAFRAGTARLKNQRLLVSAQGRHLWNCWARATKFEDSFTPQAAFDVLQGMYEAAAYGLGIVLGASPTVDQHLQSGRLVPLGLPTVQLTDFYHFVATRSSLRKRPVAAVHSWLVTEARLTRDPFGASHPTMNAADIGSDSRAH
jgi:LysR family transcriptional regulator, glycine cleavage system transcriptional activator